MEEIARDIIRWSIGFVIVSTIYLTLVWWIGRKIRAARARKKEAAENAKVEATSETASEDSDKPSATTSSD